MADDKEYQFSLLNFAFLWPNPLEDQHKEYNRFFDIDPERQRDFELWLEDILHLPRGHRRTRAFIFGDGMLAVRRARADMFSSVTFVFGNGLLEVFREFVLRTGRARGLLFKHWRVNAHDIQLLLDLSVAELDNIRCEENKKPLKVAENRRQEVT
jgi:hypothetical protein